MSPEQEHFEDLRRLLALKRHERPPPGYFNDFSRQVIARIRAGESTAGQSFLERLGARAPWLQFLLNGFEAKPIVAGAFGVGVCSLLVVGLASSERVDSSANSLSPNAGSPQTILAVQSGGLFERAFADHSATGAVLTARSSIFEEIKPHAQPVSFTVPATGN